MSPSRAVALALFTRLLLPSLALSQTITATVTGVVKDQSGGVLPGATISVTSNDTRVTKTAVTDEGGRYRIGFLNPGSYEIVAELTGFAPSQRPAVALEVTQVAELDFMLTLGGTTATVVVTGLSRSW